MPDPTLRTLLSNGPLRQRARWALRVLTPWGLEWWLATRSAKRLRSKNEETLVRGALRESERYERAVQFLLERGLDEYAVRVGSIPERSLEYVDQVVSAHLPDGVPVRALHIGNFVGVSLAHVSWMVRRKHPSSIVVSIDPNQPHMGIEDPESHARALLAHFSLTRMNLIIRAYTMSATVAGERTQALAPDNALASLQPVCGRAFDLVLVDGNHDEDYLLDEFKSLRGLLADNSIVVFDDITDFDGVASVFGRALRDESVVQLGEDGRVGIVQMRVTERAVT